MLLYLLGGYYIELHEISSKKGSKKGVHQAALGRSSHGSWRTSRRSPSASLVKWFVCWVYHIKPAEFICKCNYLPSLSLAMIPHEWDHVHCCACAYACSLRCLICWLTQCGEPAPYPSARLFVSDLRKSLGKLQHLGSNGGPQGLLDLNLNVGKKIIVDCRSFVTGSSSSFFFILDSW